MTLAKCAMRPNQQMGRPSDPPPAGMPGKPGQKLLIDVYLQQISALGKFWAAFWKLLFGWPRNRPEMTQDSFFLLGGRGTL